MDNKQISAKAIIYATIFAGVILLFLAVRSVLFSHTRIIFCDVGQGDGVYIRTKDRQDILIDAGPSTKILNCLGRHMPFYDRTIELAFVSHPQHDHYSGLNHVIDRYNIKQLLLSPVEGYGDSFDLLGKKITDGKIDQSAIYSGDRIRLSTNAYIKVLWPQKDYLYDHLQTVGNANANTSVLGFYTPTIDPNQLSQVLLFKENFFEALFTGDLDFEKLEDRGYKIMSQFKKEVSGGLEVLKVPHHGSKNGLSADFLKLADPDISVISVGKKNPYGHPSKSILDMYRALKKTYKTTADHGDIIIEVTDKNFVIKP